MRRWMSMLAGLLLVLWIPATMHCVLETVPGLDFLQSCCRDGEMPESPSDCGDELCAEVESGLYRIEDPLSSTLEPGWLAVPALLTWVAQQPGDAGARICSLSPAPPELVRRWQFLLRAALRARTPSRLS